MSERRKHSVQVAKFRNFRNRVTDWVNGWLDWLADRVQGRPAWDMCEVCGRPVHIIYLMPLPFGVERRCDDCRAGYHQAIRDFYAHRAALEASIRHCERQFPRPDAQKEAA